ncbi:hypothetical protein HanRHA438_Chr11g0497891 [Helianthus annuus]|nr:hypothetical protein HanHA300_Chr11g0397461 [Helianthus annuus]KAJ0517042.1 hypothetical protein HanHA89_Chr11g0420751 [Helianthus annuus]KAJ0685052.1 hypothetical protein HanLR1_Chr11g0398181 [Helianthus annuus]KAJ0688974.1 hypothetical protein HanOQP8_Chr11g0400351 [Helianthus annuus]KAJ0870217.1 hypothetical protein HanRHA438_Chr11g0497891 [Helianthus annuus]
MLVCCSTYEHVSRDTRILPYEPAGAYSSGYQRAHMRRLARAPLHTYERASTYERAHMRRLAHAPLITSKPPLTSDHRCASWHMILYLRASFSLRASTHLLLYIRATLTIHGNTLVQMATACNQSMCTKFCTTNSHDEQSCTIHCSVISTSLLTAKDRHNKRDRQFSRTRATGKPKTHNLHYRTLQTSLLLIPRLHAGATPYWGT